MFAFGFPSMSRLENLKAKISIGNAATSRPGEEEDDKARPSVQGCGALGEGSKGPESDLGAVVEAWYPLSLLRRQTKNMFFLGGVPHFEIYANAQGFGDSIHLSEFCTLELGQAIPQTLALYPSRSCKHGG